MKKKRARHKKKSVPAASSGAPVEEILAEGSGPVESVPVQVQGEEILSDDAVMHPDGDGGRADAVETEDATADVEMSADPDAEARGESNVEGDVGLAAATSDDGGVEAGGEAGEADEADEAAAGGAEESSSEPAQAADGVPGEVLEAAADGEAGEAGDAEGLDDGEPAQMPTSATSMDDGQLKSLVEALVFASDKPLTVQRLRQLTRVSDVRRLEQSLAALAVDYEGRGLVLQQVSGGWQFRTRSQYSVWVQQLIAGRPVRLSRAQLETLAIVAYRQPITRPEIDDIRGVDSSATLKLLLDRALIRVLGKKEEVGRPMLYGTTKEFLDFFSLGDLRELPTLREYSELSDESRRVMSDRLGVELDGGEGDDGEGGGGGGDGGDGDGGTGDGGDGGDGGMPGGFDGESGDGAELGASGVDGDETLEASADADRSDAVELGEPDASERTAAAESELMPEADGDDVSQTMAEAEGDDASELMAGVDAREASEGVEAAAATGDADVGDAMSAEMAEGSEDVEAAAETVDADDGDAMTAEMAEGSEGVEVAAETVEASDGDAVTAVMAEGSEGVEVAAETVEASDGGAVTAVMAEGSASFAASEVLEAVEETLEEALESRDAGEASVDPAVAADLLAGDADGEHVPETVD